MNRNNLLIGIIIFSLLVSLYGLGRMVITENKNSTVEMVMDEEDLRELEEYEEERVSVLEELHDSGITSIAVHEENLEDLVKRDDVDFVSGEDLSRFQRMTGEVKDVFADFSFDRDSAFILAGEGQSAERFQNLAENMEIAESARREDGEVVVYFPEWDNEYGDYGMGFDSSLIEDIREAGLRVVSRFDNNPAPGEEEADLSPEELPEESNLAIFSGDEVTGYPSELSTTAGVLNQAGYKLGIIESFIAQQDGVSSLAELMNSNLVRVHSIQKDEMEKYDFEKVVNRYFRAARERNVRVFYLKPFTTEKLDFSEDELLDLNVEYINTLHSGLEEEGYSVGEAHPFDSFSTHPAMVVLLSLGVIAAGVYLGRQFKVNYRPGLISFAFLALVVELLLIFLGRHILLRQILALGVAIIFPSLAIIYGVLKKGLIWGGNWFKRYISAGLISLAGGLLLASLLADTGFIVKVYQFRGVKLAFLLPLLIITFYYYRDNSGSLSLARAVNMILDRKIRVKDVLLVIILFAGGLVYIGRTGNISYLPVPAWEETVRNLLERVFAIRPRFKAFLLGHPFLILSLYYRKWSNRIWFIPLVLLAAVGQITILNTFSHLHTPLLVSIIRFIHGYWLGLLVGLILLAAARYIRRIYNFPREAADE
ncbi:MAG: DUF5693 family protein [Bacillota bacterium]